MKSITVVLLALIPLMAIANGSETGHNNGHHEHPGTNSSVSNDVAVGVKTDIANRVNSRSAVNSSIDNYTKSAGGKGGSGTGVGQVLVGGDNHRYSASRAATIYTQTCQSGMSAQTRSGGFGVVNRDPLCDYLKNAAVAREAYEYALANPTQCEVVKAEVNCPIDGFVDCQIKTCTSPKAAKYLTAYHDNLDAAFALTENTQHPALWDRVAGFLVRPAAIMAALFLL